MPLTPVEGSPGRWADPERPGDGPGLFAVLIGISRYRHLAGGPSPAPQTYGLPQLFTSATAAWRLFEWLRTRHRGAAPVSRVWMLLSPTPEELAANPALGAHACEPTFEGMSDAIIEWDAAMRALAEAAAAGSTSFLFFSGHGLEVHQEQQILLPSDYLKPPAMNVNRAVGTNRMRRALATLKVPQQLYFLDACRNDHTALRALDVQGTDVLNVPVASAANPMLASPMFYATAAGMQAWQRKDPSKGTSIFADALIGGLSGDPLLRRTPSGAGWAVTVYPLQRFLKAKMAEIHATMGGRPQPLVLTGNVDDIEITLLEGDVGDTGGPLAFSEAEDRFDDGVEADGPFDPRAAPSRGAGGTRGFLEENLPLPWLVEALRGARLYAYRDGAWGDDEAFDLLRIRGSADPSFRPGSFHPGSFLLDIRPRRPAEVFWLTIPDGTLLDDAEVFGCVLGAGPGADEAPRYQVEVVPGDEERILRVQAGLSPDQRGPLGAAGDWWHRYEEGSLEDALAPFSEGFPALEMLSPLAAVVVGILALKGASKGAWADPARRPLDWLPGISTLPDGAALLAAVARRTGEPEAVSSILSVLRLTGLPWTAEGLSLVADALSDPGVGGDEDLGAVAEATRKALRYHRPGGLFAVFSGPADVVGPALLTLS